MEDWCPFASRTWTAKGSGPHVAGPWRGTLHDTEGSTAAGALAAYQSTGDYPHFTVSEYVIEQHCPISVGATALKHPAGTIDTNRLSAVQIEIVGSCDRAYATKYRLPYVGDFSAAQLANVAKVMRWIEAQTGIAFDGHAAFTATSASTAPRMSVDTWRRFNSWCGHQHVPNNDHWDPGQLPIDKLAPFGAATSIIPEDDDMEKLDDIVSEHRWPYDGAVVRLLRNGDVRCYGLTYRGNINQIPAADRLNWSNGPGVVRPIDVNDHEKGYKVDDFDANMHADFTPEWAAQHLR
jgi:hypothetical protein